MDFQTEIKAVVDRTPGAVGGILTAQDGMPVQSYAAERGLDLVEELGAEFSALLAQLHRVSVTAGLGEIQDFALRTGNYQILVSPTGPEYFLVLVLHADGLTGKGRWLVDELKPRLLAEL